MLDTPISETAIVGHAVGAAAAGLRPVVEILFMDFLPIAWTSCPTRRPRCTTCSAGRYVPAGGATPSGAGIGAAAHHSQSLEALVCHIPGLKTIAPATPADAKGLLISAIRDDNPVVFLEHKMLYAMKGEVPEGEYIIPIGKADVKREGSDVTLVCWSAMVRQCLAAAEDLARRASAPRCSTCARSCRWTRRRSSSRWARPSAGDRARGLPHRRLRRRDRGHRGRRRLRPLDAPIMRVAGPDTPVPFSPALEAEFIVKADKIVAAVASWWPDTTLPT